MTRLPFHCDMRRTMLLEHATDLGVFRLEAIPSWPCYAEDGAGKVTDVRLVLSLTDHTGRVYTLSEVDDDE